MVILQRTAQRRTVVAGGIGIGYSEHSPTNVYAGRKSENMIVCVGVLFVFSSERLLLLKTKERWR